MTWTIVLYLLGALGGGLYAWWDTSLSTMRARCAVDNALRSARDAVIDEMAAEGFVEWAAFARRHWREPS